MTVPAVEKVNMWIADSVIKSNSSVFITIQCKTLDIIMGFQVLETPVNRSQVYFPIQFVIDLFGIDRQLRAVNHFKNTLPAFG